MTDNPRRRVEGLAAAGLFGSAVTGVAAVVLALVAAFAGDFSAAGLALIAAGVAFGFLANAFLRE
jgi:hypothetical protein